MGKQRTFLERATLAERFFVGCGVLVMVGAALIGWGAETGSLFRLVLGAFSVMLAITLYAIGLKLDFPKWG